MSVIQRQIEAQGVSTVSISLFRPFTEAVKPPRALWVPFPFGRPLGAPNNKAIQRKVIFSAFQLFEREKGPVLEDLVLTESESHLDARNQKVGQSCGAKGCNFDDALSSVENPAPPEIAPYSGDFAQIYREIEALRLHHAAYVEQYGGRTQIGYSGVTSETIERAADALHRFVGKEAISIPPGVGVSSSDSLATQQSIFVRLCADDLKAYYLESRLAQKGGGSELSTEYNDWLWFGTKVGSLIVAARGRVIEITDRTKDPNWMIARAMVPRGYGDSGYTMTSQNTVKSNS